MNKPLVSVIVPTKNSAAFISSCLSSIRAQTYQNIEIIVVDNYSKDPTIHLATQYTSHIYIRGPERSAQRNFGVSRARGEYVAIIDSDMELTPGVIEACVRAMATPPRPVGIIIPEESFGEGFWAKCKSLERSFYIGVPGIEAARFMRRATYQQLGGYDETLVSGEDWDLERRLEQTGRVAHIAELIRHNEGHLSLARTLKKKYYYARHAASYLRKQPEKSLINAQAGPLQRYKLYFSKPARLFVHPLVGLGMLTMKTAEFAAGALGYLGLRLGQA